MLSNLLCLIAGIACGNFFIKLPHLSTLIGLSLITAACLLLAWVKTWRHVFYIASAGFCFVLGLAWITLALAHALSDRLPVSLQQKPLWVRGHIANIPSVSPLVSSFTFKLFASNKTQAPVSEGTLRLLWYHAPKSLAAGQCWRLPVKLKRIHGYHNPHGQDSLKQAMAQHLIARGYVDNHRQALPCYRQPWTHAFTDLRTYLYQHFYLNPGAPHRGLLLALTLGMRSELSPEAWQVLLRTGTAHLLSVSGMHVGLVFFMMLALFNALGCGVRWFWLNFPQTQVGLIGALLAAGFYAGLTGWGLPAQRAVFMLSLWVLMRLMRRKVALHYVLLWSVLLILFRDPLAALTASFWLSSYAVAWILYVCQSQWPNATSLSARALLQLKISVGLVPLSLLYFHQISWVSVICNLFAVPVVSLWILPVSLGCLWLQPVAPAGVHAIQTLMHPVLTLFWRGLVFAALAPFAASVVYINAFSVFCLMAMIWLFFLGKLHRLRHCAWLLLPGLMISNTVQLKPGAVRVTVLDVGQGLSVWVQTAHHQLLYDTGAKYGKYFDAGQRLVVPFIQSMHHQQIDKVVISHADNDHVGGLGAVERSLKVRQLLASEPMHFAYSQCIADQQWTWDGVRFDILHPSKTWHMPRNEQSCVLKISTAKQQILLTGDIEKRSEQHLVQMHKAALKADILLAPHHGSRTSSTVPFLKAVRPRWIVISSGMLNRYRHPSKTVLKRYKKILPGVNVLNTAQNGAIVLSLQAEGGIHVGCVADQARHPWSILKSCMDTH